jgi:hypothetical protein
VVDDGNFVVIINDRSIAVVAGFWIGFGLGLGLGAQALAVVVEAGLVELVHGRCDLFYTAQRRQRGEGNVGRVDAQPVDGVQNAAQLVAGWAVRGVAKGVFADSEDSAKGEGRGEAGEGVWGEEDRGGGAAVCESQRGGLVGGASEEQRE